MYNDMTELVHAIADRMDVVPLNQFKTDPELQRLMALWHSYNTAIEESKQYGWIGVGCITFAENRLRSMQQLPLIKDADLRGFDEYGNYGEQNHPIGAYDPEDSEPEHI